MKQFKPTADMISAANAYVMAKAYTETIRPEIEKIQSDLLQKFRYKWDVDRVTGGSKNRRDILEFTDNYGDYCKDWKMTYLIKDSDFGHLMAEYHAAVTAAGYKVKPDCCPLLVAENLQRQAEHLIFELFEPITGISHTQIVSGRSGWQENYQQYLTLTMQLMAPYLKNPFAKAA